MTKTLNHLNLKLAGAAGDGILNAGQMMFAKTCKRAGLYVFSSAEYPSLIRGGHNHLNVRVSAEPVFSQIYEIDLLVAFNKESVEKHYNLLSEKGAIIYDAAQVKDAENIVDDKSKLYEVPLLKFANEAGGRIMKNTVAMGAVFGLVNFDFKLLEDAIKTTFGKKGEEIVNNNIKAAKSGYDYAKEKYPDYNFELKENGKDESIFISGHEAASLGAIKAGCKMICAYPMTPASSVMGTLEKFALDANLVVKQAESEVAAINMAVGANYAGIRAMTATSGGGFALMVEGFGMSMQMETPLVVIESMRPGPATGMATHTGQGDLRYLMYNSTDEAPRVIMAPGCADEAFHMTADAFNIAEKYQMSVIVLTDKYVGESYFTVKPFDDSKYKVDRGKLLDKFDGDEYKRFEITKDGVSPRTVPGVPGGMYTCSSYESDEYGFECEDEHNKIAMSQKRLRKLDYLEKELPKPKIVGDKNADFTIVSWGSTKYPIMQAIDDLKAEGIKVNFLQVHYMIPFHTEEIKKLIEDKNTILVENNQSGQLGDIIREKTGIIIENKILKYDGRPFFPSEVLKGVKVIKDGKKGTHVFSRNEEVASENFGVKK
jgi:2-oxoglutarate ferredoxin oxidoreductase subunit alpha